MMWNDKAFHSLNYELKKVFKEKIIKLSIDGNFTCPNRDGKISTDGCIFCSESGSGDFTSGRHLSISEQIQKQKDMLSSKWANGKYIAYFQNFTSTYDTIDSLKKKYEEALLCEDIVGIAIATRPDCIDSEILEYLSELNNKTFLWIELGLQSIHEKSSSFIRRGYELEVFETTFTALKNRDIKTVVHLISNLPTESEEDFLESVKYISKLKPWGVKIHLLHILKNTDLYNYYLNNPFNFMTADEYIAFICKSLSLLHPDIVIHRLTGDGKKEDLVAPTWPLNKRYVLNGIDKYLKENKLFQGSSYNEIL